MPERTENPVLIPPESAETPALQCSGINQEWLDEISGTEQLAVVAAKAQCSAKLPRRKIDIQSLNNSDFETCATNILARARHADVPGIEAAQLQA